MDLSLNAQRLLRIAVLAAAVLAPSSGIGGPLAYITNHLDNTITVIDTATDRVVDRFASIPGGAGPWGVAADPERGKVYVSHPFYRSPQGAPDQLALIGTGKRHSKRGLSVDHGAFCIAQERPSGRLYQASAVTGSISAFGANGRLMKQMELQLNWPLGIAVGTKGGHTTLFVTENKSDSLAIVDPDTGRLDARIPVGRGPVGVAVSEYGERVYVANYGDNTLSVVDVAEGKVVGTVPIGYNPYAVAVSPDGKRVYVTNQPHGRGNRPIKGSVSVVDSQRLTEIQRVKVGKTPIGISVNPKGTKLYVANYDSDTVTVIATQGKASKSVRAEMMQVTNTISVGNGPVAFGSFIAGPEDELLDFVGGAFEQWGQSQFLQALGLQPSGPTAAQFNALEAEVNQLSSQIATVIQEEQAIIFQISQLSDYLQKQSLDTLNDSFNAMENQQNTVYMNFVSAVQDGTGGPVFPWSQIVQTSTIMDNIANGIGCVAGAGGNLDCQTPINLLINDALNLTSSPVQPVSGAVFNVPNFASQLFGAIQSYALEGFPQAGSTSSYNVSGQMTYNDETMMAYLSQMVTTAQQGYDILATLLYLKYNAPLSAGFVNISIPVPGYNDNNSYEQNATALACFYYYESEQCSGLSGPGVIQTLQANATASILSDNPGNPSQSGSYTNVKTLHGVSGGTWTHSCNLYVWSGASTLANQGYSGAWSGTSLTTQCFSGSPPPLVVGYTIDLSSACASASSANLSFYSGLNASNLQASQLQCNNLNPGGYSAPGWNNDAGYEFGADWSPDEDWYLGINTPGFGDSPYTGPIEGPLSQSSDWSGWGINYKKVPGMAFSSIWQYNLPSGLIGTFAVLGQDGEYTTTGVYLQVLCLEGDQWCSQLPGEGPGGGGGQLGAGYSSICIGHQTVTLKWQENSTQQLVYTGEGC